jgi:hypothetical protein
MQGMPSGYEDLFGIAVAKTLIVPLWFVFAVWSVLPLRWWWLWRGRWRREWRIRQGRCGRCGYDLTGNTSGVCPECGAKIPVLSEATA